MLGTSVGTYRITGSIGQGGMGVVYLAEHALLGRQAAVKVLLPELSQNQEIVTRFFNEARAATAIRHPGIVEIYDFGWNPDGSAYIVMEFLQGESLAARITRGRVGVAGGLAIVRQVAGALAAAHAKGIVHRDLKPDNVFLVADPEVPGGERIKLLDFGIAKLAGDQPGGQKTRTGAVIGTPTYMAPEQCRGVAIDHRADLYSLGCMLFELISGRPPHVGEGLGDVLAAHIHVAPPALSSLVPDVPPAVEQLVQRLLIKDPQQRMQSAEEVIHAVDAALGGPVYRTGPRLSGEVAAPIASMPTTLSGAAGAHTTGAGTLVTAPRRKLGLWIGIGGAVAAAAVAAIVVTGGGGGKGGDAKPVAAEPVPAPEAAPPPPPTPVPAPQAVTPPPAPVEPPAAPAAPATVAVSFDSTPPGAKILRGDEVLGKTPFTGTLPRADAAETLTLRLSGYKDAIVTVHPAADVTAKVKLDRKRSGGGGQGGGGDRDRGVNPFGN